MDTRDHREQGDIETAITQAQSDLEQYKSLERAEPVTRQKSRFAERIGRLIGFRPNKGITRIEQLMTLEERAKELLQLRDEAKGSMKKELDRTIAQILEKTFPSLQDQLKHALKAIEQDIPQGTREERKETLCRRNGHLYDMIREVEQFQDFLSQEDRDLLALAKETAMHVDKHRILAPKRGKGIGRRWIDRNRH